MFLVTITFFLVRLMPGNPFDTGNVSEQVLETIEEEYGLNQPLHVQYAVYMNNLLHGDLGMSMKKPGVSVNEILAQGAGISGKMGVLAFAAALLSGTVLGAVQATTQRTWVKRGILLWQSAGMGIPNFVVALLLLFVFAVTLGWLPSAGITEPENYVLPVAALAVYPSCVISKIICTAAETEKRSGYVKFLRAQGMTRGRIFAGHLLRPVFSQIIVSLGQMLVSLITGSFVVESIFTIPGLGREFVNSISNRDYTVVTGLTVFMGAVMITVQIVLDVAQLFLEPRLKFFMSQRQYK